MEHSYLICRKGSKAIFLPKKLLNRSDWPYMLFTCSTLQLVCLDKLFRSLFVIFWLPTINLQGQVSQHCICLPKKTAKFQTNVLLRLTWYIECIRFSKAPASWPLELFVSTVLIFVVDSFSLGSFLRSISLSTSWARGSFEYIQHPRADTIIPIYTNKRISIWNTIYVQALKCVYKDTTEVKPIRRRAYRKVEQHQCKSPPAYQLSEGD